MSQNKRQETGFSLLGMLIAVGIVAVLAAIAVPKFHSAVAKANTAKIQADLSTIETAMGVYALEKGVFPTSGDLSALDDYIVDAKNLKPPTGQCLVNGELTTLSDNAAYSIGKAGDGEEMRALCDGKTLSAFGERKSTGSGNQS
ncbi:competence type IV pilus major pilin ComGC [uncultured Mitsuokella sp.]|uniref:competence type IV pilus major pilin ComGC n=1 Tax=uncultured Mitsuokella sp. TaxID=453120 RepID=UPI0026DD9E67|nr:prepilin-type N-terminal cleavage/methylation domain-containing protein [uncultured Mitsuokella sp.]